MKSFLQRWLITTLAVLAAVYIVPGIDFARPLDLLVASLILGILNAFLRPLLFVISLPLLVVTLGLFWFVINALLLYFVGALVSGFHVQDFWSAFFGALIISIVSLAVNSLVGTGESRITFHRGKSSAKRRGDGGEGPTIDI